MTKEEVLSGLKAGRRLRCDRKDEPLLPWLLELCEKGELNARFIEHDEQSSCIEFTWAGVDNVASS